MLILIGAPGSGKSSVGAQVADRLGVRFVDVTELVAQTAHKPVGHVFIDDGEDTARDLEASAMRSALASNAGVLAMPSACVVHVDFARLVAQHQVCWLKVDMPHLARRLRLGSVAPGVFGAPRAMLLTLLAERDPLYRSVATMTVDTSRLSQAEVVEQVLSLITDTKH
ncbi:MAG: shikimate kinase [Propionibacteriaceae bacterium]